MSEDVVLRLNPIAVQARIVQWLSLCSKNVTVIHDAERSTDDELHFDAYDEEAFNEDDHVAPDISEAMSQATARLGRAFTFETLSDSIHIVVRGPNASQSRQLFDAFSHHKAVLQERQWNIYFCVLCLFVSFIWFCCSLSKLHKHWHAYETPWETMFDTVFSLFIHFGDWILLNTGIS